MFSSFTIIGILAVLLIYFPGIVFKRFYYSGPHSKQFKWGDFQGKLLTGFIAGIFVHIIMIAFACLCSLIAYRNCSLIVNKYNVFNEQLKDVISKKFIYLPIHEVSMIFVYWLSVILIGAIIGYSLHKIVNTYKLDLRFNILRFDNHWHYYFRGEELTNFMINKAEKRNWYATQVDVLVQTAEGNILYTGILYNYELSHESCKIDNLYLTHTMRYSKSNNLFKDVPGDYFIIPFEKCYNINLRYLYSNADADKYKKESIIKRRIRVLFYILWMAQIALIPFIGKQNGLDPIGIIITSILYFFTSLSFISFVQMIARRSRYREKYPENYATLLVSYILVFVISTILFFSFLHKAY